MCTQKKPLHTPFPTYKLVSIRTECVVRMCTPRTYFRPCLSRTSCGWKWNNKVRDVLKVDSELHWLWDFYTFTQWFVKCWLITLVWSQCNDCSGCWRSWCRCRCKTTLLYCLFHWQVYRPVEQAVYWYENNWFLWLIVGLEARAHVPSSTMSEIYKLKQCIQMVL